MNDQPATPSPAESTTDSPVANGADLLVATALNAGIDVCFANPGTTELHLVEAMARRPELRTVLGLFEGVCSGAADAYARMTRRPALGLFHLGPGFANALANLHNARRHGTPMVNVIGDQASWHLAADAPLTSEIDKLATWAGHFDVADQPDETGDVLAAAFTAATTGNGQIASVAVSADAAWGSTSSTPPTPTSGQPAPVNDEAVAAAATALSAPHAAIIVGGPWITTHSQRLLGRIRAATGAKVFMTRSARIDRKPGLPSFPELAYFPEPAIEAVADVEVAVLAGRPEPVTFFGYPDIDSHVLPKGARRVELCGADTDLEAALAHLADVLGAHDDEPVAPPPPIELSRGGRIDASSLGAAFALGIPENAIMIGEYLTSGAGYVDHAASAEPHTLLAILGGAIGGGLPAAVGAAVAAPDRPVVALQADGSAMYTIQSLWTMAREQLNVTVVMAANRRYRILEVELARAGMDTGPDTRSLTELQSPEIDFVSIAGGFGVAARAVTTTAELIEAMASATATPGPFLIEAQMA